ncbi:polynucleotide adenylyltransferase [Drechslerella dactyloides]|uniref:polynucleotide adenylyltransferase n=1 Tax=Drechslerella dactyloides TaxID=74499 RepID=A0AAD6J3C5_DREDA|nr:polynucleotide adenylyltransferase [Drechslerella dactyloides]
MIARTDNQEPRQWGVTPAISHSLPTDQEVRINNELIEELKAMNSFESAEESQKRVDVLKRLQKITEEFVRQVCSSKNQNELATNSAGGKVFTYGSYRLGVVGPGSDIDTLVVAPKFVTREDFFKFYPPLLKALNKPNEPPMIEELAPVPDAFVPIIKFVMSGISIDLIFCKLGVTQVPPDMTLEDKNLLRGLDEKELRSLNGTRVTDEILTLVPAPAVFKHALRAIKIWAKCRAIYGNVYGFPGGVAWAMLVARICQLYPAAVSAVIVSKFFRILGQWNWPQPVLLKPIEDGPLNVRVWNPRLYPSDKNHLMPIITPAYPSMCSTHNITPSTKAAILGEMAKAADIVDRIITGNATWNQLFQRHTFFTKDYKYYLTVKASAKDQEQSVKWSGLVESKIRHLVMKLEMLSDVIASARPYVKPFEKVQYCRNEEEAQKIAMGQHVADSPPAEAANPATGETAGEVPEQEKEGGVPVWITTFYIGIELTPGMVGQVNISWPAQEFYIMCHNWEGYDEQMHCVKLELLRKGSFSVNLPDECFDFGKGDVKPMRPVVKKKVIRKVVSSSEVSQSGMKRTHAEENPNGDEPPVIAEVSVSNPRIGFSEETWCQKLEDVFCALWRFDLAHPPIQPLRALNPDGAPTSRNITPQFLLKPRSPIPTPMNSGDGDVNTKPRITLNFVSLPTKSTVTLTAPPAREATTNQKPDREVIPTVQLSDDSIVKKPTNSDGGHLIEQSLTETDTYYLLDYHTVTHDYSSTIESGILSTHTTTIECTPGSTNPSFYLQATNAPDIDEQYYWAKGSTPRIIPDAVDAKFTPDISDATVFTLDSDKRLVTVRDGGPLYADVDYFGYFEIVHLMSEADIALRDWNYLRCDVRPPSGRYPGDYGELYCLADGAFNRDVWNYCPEYFDSYNTGLVLGNYWSESSPDCFNVTFLVKPVCES